MFNFLSNIPDLARACQSVPDQGGVFQGEFWAGSHTHALWGISRILTAPHTGSGCSANPTAEFHRNSFSSECRKSYTAVHGLDYHRLPDPKGPFSSAQCRCDHFTRPVTSQSSENSGQTTSLESARVCLQGVGSSSSRSRMLYLS